MGALAPRSSYERRPYWLLYKSRLFRSVSKFNLKGVSPLSVCVVRMCVVDSKNFRVCIVCAVSEFVRKLIFSPSYVSVTKNIDYLIYTILSPVSHIVS